MHVDFLDVTEKGLFWLVCSPKSYNEITAMQFYRHLVVIPVVWFLFMVFSEFLLLCDIVVQVKPFCDTLISLLQTFAL